MQPHPPVKVSEPCHDDRARQAGERGVEVREQRVRRPQADGVGVAAELQAQRAGGDGGWQPVVAKPRHRDDSAQVQEAERGKYAVGQLERQLRPQHREGLVGWERGAVVDRG